MTPKERAAIQQALDTSLRVEQDSEECEGDDGMVMVVPLDAYNDMMEAITALREALEQLDCQCGDKCFPVFSGDFEYCETCGKPTALEQPVSQEPVAWAYEYGTDRGDAVNEIRWYPNLTALNKPKPIEGCLIRNVRPLYAAPQQCKECGAKQAEIDRLMLEYCPVEMTKDQIEKWMQHQKAQQINDGANTTGEENE